MSLRSLSCFILAVCIASAVQAQNYRKGMTWTVAGQAGGYVHVGSDGVTNAYSGDTTIEQYLPVLCLQVDDQPAPGISFDFYNGWARGSARATAPVRGTALTSQAAGDAICFQAFGGTYRMAAFHDGRYGPDFSQTGGWSFWAEGSIPAGTRFWTAIVDQPANPWNSAGTIPPDDYQVLQSYAQQAVSPMLTLAQNPQFRDLVHTKVAQQFDGDDNVLLSDLLSEAVRTGIVNPYSAEYQSLTATISSFANVNGTSFEPQIYIPNFETGLLIQPENVEMVVFESNLAQTQLPVYVLEGGSVTVKSQPADEAYAENFEVWVISVNERVNMGGEALRQLRALDATGLTSRKASRPGNGPIAANATCNPTGLRNNKGLEYLNSWRVPNPSAVEHWTSGKLELRVIVLGKGGAEIKNAYFGKIKRNTVKSGVYPNLFMTTWDRAIWGDTWAYKWVEEDNGPTITIALKLDDWIKKLLKIPVGVSITAVFESKHDDAGTAIVNFDESTYIEYSTGVVYFNVCSMGGEGGSGFDNLARTATVAASSTYPGYSPARVNDGSQSTALGGTDSWANNANTPLPQWVQLDFGVVKTFSRVELFTTATYALRDYDIQIWNGVTWQNVATVNFNTAAHRTHTFAPVSSRLVRVLCRRGPDHQAGYVRVNEFEVYP